MFHIVSSVTLKQKIALSSPSQWLQVWSIRNHVKPLNIHLRLCTIKPLKLWMAEEWNHVADERSVVYVPQQMKASTWSKHLTKTWLYCICFLPCISMVLNKADLIHKVRREGKVAKSVHIAHYKQLTFLYLQYLTLSLSSVIFFPYFS
jgi:hypothetical protein